MRDFLRHYELPEFPARHSVLHALVDAYRQWSGGREAPRIAILDWREVPSYSEFVLFAEYFKSQGLECIITIHARWSTPMAASSRVISTSHLFTNACSSAN